jgi:hypothetical protein
MVGETRRSLELLTRHMMTDCKVIIRHSMDMALDELQEDGRRIAECSADLS